MSKIESKLSISADLGEYGKKTFSNYEDMVNYLVLNRIDYSFSNSNLEHSVMLINKFVTNIDGIFKLYTKTFKKNIFNNLVLISGIKEFLERKDTNKLQILVEDQSRTVNLIEEDNNIFFDSLREFLINKKIEMKNVNSSSVQNKYRYMVLGTAYRYCNSGDDEDFSAKVNFNSKTDSGILQDHFDLIYSQSSKMA